MCGIFGIYKFNNSINICTERVANAVKTLKRRGPDDDNFLGFNNCFLGHTRLSIIDTSVNGSQPMKDETGRYAITFNGEFYNYKSCRNKLIENGFSFFSESDTEVLLKMYIHYGNSFLNHINGCFAFAIYDKTEDKLIVARDRLGIKPLLYYKDDDLLIFSSEIKAIVEYGIKKELNYEALPFYFGLNYIPAPLTILKNVHKLLPGQYIEVNSLTTEIKTWWVPPLPDIINNNSFKPEDSLRELLFKSVERRLIADVPLGCFLSGGIDSAIIAGIASTFIPDLKTFTIGFSDNAYYDESNYAEITARKHNTSHTTCRLKTQDLLDNVSNILDIVDEPFADSSAVALNILSIHTRKELTVALSGDGADELFGGYNKHAAHLSILNKDVRLKILPFISPFINMLDGSRAGSFSNKLRQLKKMKQGMSLNDADRYWRWCNQFNEKNLFELFNTSGSYDKYNYYKKLYTSTIAGKDINEILYSDMRLVLPNDMLVKADKFSMSEGLEIRVPFLDHTVVEYAMQLPSKYKISPKQRKIILKNAFPDMIAPEILNRPKHGFEIPLEAWLKNELQPLLNKYTQSELLLDQNIFNKKNIDKMKKQLNSNMPGDAPAKLWAILVFQHWWNKYLN